MAFDMYTPGRKDCIDHHEEALFALINDDCDAFPRLNELWVAFYSGPRISPDMANDLVQELLTLHELIQDETDSQCMSAVIQRLVDFFKYAHRHSLQIRCVSD